MAQSLEPLLKAFLLAKKLELRRATSFRDLNYFLQRVCAGLVSQYPDLNFEQLNASQLRQLIHWWEGGASGFTTNRATIKKMVMYLKYFCRWCCEEGLTEINPAEKLRYLSGCHYDKTPRVQREDLDRFSRVLQGDGYWQITLRAIVAVLLDGAARATEVCNLELSDVDLSNKRITIRDVEKKRDKTSAMFGIGEKTRVALTHYLIARARRARPDETKLFVNFAGTALKPDNLHQKLGHFSKKAGLKNHITAQQFRVTAAVEAALNGSDAFQVQALLRHEDIAMTLRYMRLAQEEKDAMRCSKNSLADKLISVEQQNRRYYE
jgi:site-specific recombinase XerD